MAYVTLTRDFSEVEKPVAGIGLTKRQLKAFAAGIIVGLPVFLIAKQFVDITMAIMCMAAIAAPIIFILLYKKDGMYLEVHIRYWYETHFVRNTERPYETHNIYDQFERMEQFKKEVEEIVFKGKSEEEIAQIKKAGESSVVRIGKKKITIPMKGRIDMATKKELERAVKKAKIKGDIPESAQDSIPYKAAHEDGIFETDTGYFTQTISFTDVTYQLLDNDPKNILFERWCRLLNYFDPEKHLQMNYGNMEVDQEEYFKDFIIPRQDDDYNLVRKEYSGMLVKQFAKGTNNLKKVRFLTYGIHAENYKSACIKMTKINRQIEKDLKKIGSKPHVLNGYERLELLFQFFHPGTKEKFMWNFDLAVKTGLTSKDFIAPSSFCFKNEKGFDGTKYFRMGDRIGAVSYIRVMASDMEDRVIDEILNLPSNVWLTVHSDAIKGKEALDYARDNISDIQGMIGNIQKNANQKGVDMFMLPPDLEEFKEAGDKLFKALKRKDEKLFTVVLTIVQTAKTRRELEDSIFELNEILAGNQCSLVRLDNRQEQGLMSALPLGYNAIEVKRTFTTTDLGIFVPFTTKEMYSSNGQYYGMNSLSNNVIMINRKNLVNPNGLIFGMPGFGKSFFIKREILDVFLKTTDDIFIIDWEGEYKWLVKMLGGQVIDVALDSNQFVNPMEIYFVENEDDRDYDAINEKINFCVSMCELILGNNGKLTKNEVTAIDIACKNIYHEYAQNPIPEKQPIIQNLFDELLNLEKSVQDIEEIGEIGRNLAISLLRYTRGSLSYFNHKSNVDINSRIVCFNLKQMNKNQQDLVMLIIQETIWNRVAQNRELGKATWAYFDEFHLILRNLMTAAYSVEIWKRFRKWGGVPTGLTQNIKDLFKSPEIQNILDVTNFIAMLNQAGDDGKLLSEHLDLSSDEEEYLKTGEPGKGLLWVEGIKVPFEDEFPMDTLCYKVMTTKPSEAIQESSVKKKATG